MWMTFLDLLLRQAVRQGTLIVHPPTGSPSRYGDGTGQPVTVRINDPSLPRRIMLNPDLDSKIDFGKILKRLEFFQIFLIYGLFIFL